MRRWIGIIVLGLAALALPTLAVPADDQGACHEQVKMLSTYLELVSRARNAAEAHLAAQAVEIERLKAALAAAKAPPAPAGPKEVP